MTATSDRAPDVLVVGGGIIGCSVALSVSRAGGRVTVLDRAEPGREATWAAGGMLSPLGEELRPDPFLQLGMESLDLYPAFVDEVVELSGIDVDLDLSGKLQVAVDEDQADHLRGRLESLSATGHRARWLDPAELRDCGTRGVKLADGVRGGLLLGDEGRVDNRALGAAVFGAARARGVRFRSGTAARAVSRSADRARGVTTEAGDELAAGAVVLAAGAWSGRIEGLPRPLPVRPVRGQMVALDAGPVRLTHVLETPSAYLIPRRDGTIVVGSTVEEGGFDRIPTPDGVAGLIRAASSAIPALADAPVREAWAGLRPGTPDDLPILGPDPDLPGLFYATGHYRNGILLAPATGRYLSGLLLGDTRPSGGLFRPDRFSA